MSKEPQCTLILVITLTHFHKRRIFHFLRRFITEAPKLKDQTLLTESVQSVDLLPFLTANKTFRYKFIKNYFFRNRGEHNISNYFSNPSEIQFGLQHFWLRMN